MKNLTLKQLRYFEALARHGRFRHAADACAISQPALSMQIKELEEELGNELFERSAREVKLTAFGQMFACPPNLGWLELAGNDTSSVIVAECGGQMQG